MASDLLKSEIRGDAVEMSLFKVEVDIKDFTVIKSQKVNITNCVVCMGRRLDNRACPLGYI